jgi:hypothetical protein
VDFNDAPYLDARLLERFLDIGKLGVFHLEHKVAVHH